MIDGEKREVDNRITKVLIYIMAFASVEISYLCYITKVFRVMYVGIQCLCIFFIVASIIKRHKIEYFDIFLIVFICIELLSTYINKLPFKELIIDLEKLLFLSLTAKWCLRVNARVYISAMAQILTGLTLINTLTAFLVYPNALFYYTAGSPMFFIGGDNTSTRIYILATLFSILNSREKKGILPLISLVNIFIFSFLRDIGNGKVCSLILIVGYILFDKIKINMPKKPIIKITVINFAIFFLIVVFNKISLFSFIIVNLLHRDLTLTTRTTIWNITVNKILEKPILGNGYLSGEAFESMLPGIIGINAHNTFLMVMFIGGTLLFLVFVMFFWLAAKKYDSNQKERKMYILPVALFTMLLRAQVEGGDATYIIFVLYLIYSHSKIGKESKLITESKD